MNREQLEEVRARALAATPGPWLREWAFSTHFVVPLAAHDVAAGNVSRLKPRQRADAEFIAHARTDVPALLDEIDRLTAVAWKLRTVMIQQHEAGSHFLWIDDCPACVKARDECDGDFSCDQQKAWQKEYEEALSLSLAAASTAEGSAEGGTSKGSEVSP